MCKLLYDYTKPNDYSITTDGERLDQEIEAALRPIMVKWLKEGYNLLEMIHLINVTVSILEIQFKGVSVNMMNENGYLGG